MEKKKKSNKLLVAMGFVTLTAVSAVVAPKVIGFLSEEFYSKSDITDDKDDDWDPVIVKKHKERETKDGEL